MKTLITMINDRILAETGEVIHFEADAQFTRQMTGAARDFPNYLITADPKEGIAQLNDVMVRRAVAALTDTEEAGQYVPGNYLHRQSRHVGRADDGLREHARQGAAVILGGNIFKRHNDAFQKEQKALRASYTNNAYEDMFLKTRPRAGLEFNEL